MLNEIVVLGHGEGYIIIGFSLGTDVNDRASFNKDHGREFLGITQEDLDTILAGIPNSRQKVEEILEVPSLTQRILQKLRG